MKKKLLGGRLEYREALYGYGDPDALPIADTEIAKMFKDAMPKLKKPLGKIIVFGTMSTDHGSYKDLWKDL